MKNQPIDPTLADLPEMVPRETVTAMAAELTMLRALVNAAPDYIYAKDRQGRFIFANPATARISGSPSPESLIGKTDYDFNPPEIAEPLFASEQLLMATGTPLIDYEDQIFNVATGGPRWHLSTKVPLRDAAGEIIGLVGVTRDITERRKMEDNVKSHYEEMMMLYNVINLMPEMVFAKDRDGRFLFANSYVAEVMGASGPEELIGKTDFDYYDRAFAEACLATEQTVLRTGEPITDREECAFNAKTGEPFWHLVSKMPLRDNDGTVIGTFGISHDITQRKKLAADLERHYAQVAALNVELQETHRQLNEAEALARIAQANELARLKVQTIVENAPYGMLTVTEDGCIDLVNRQAELIFGYDRAELVGKARSLILPLGPADVGDEHRETVHLGRRKDGAIVDVEVTDTPLHGDHLTETVVTVVDITERMRIKANMERYIRELARSNSDLDNFAYVASHDLKSPLHGINQLATWIAHDLGDNIDDDTKTHLKLMRSRIHRMENLLDNLLAYSRIGRADVALSSVDSGELVRETFDLLAYPRPMTLTVAPNMPVFVTFRTPLEMIFRNLLSNAAKHHDKDHGQIEIGFEKIDDGYAFTVADDGPGIPTKHHERVFGMFQTLRPRDEIEGSGMGLAMIKKAVETFGGTVSLTSEGRGCLFRFTWPSENSLRRYLDDRTL